MPDKKSQTKGKATTSGYKDEMGNPRTKAQQKQWEKDELNMIDYPGRPKMKIGGSTSKSTKFASLAPPYNKATFADKIAGAKGAKPKMKMGGSCGTPKSLGKRK